MIARLVARSPGHPHQMTGSKPPAAPATPNPLTVGPTARVPEGPGLPVPNDPRIRQPTCRQLPARLDYDPDVNRPNTLLTI